MHMAPLRGVRARQRGVRARATIVRLVVRAVLVTCIGAALPSCALGDPVVAAAGDVACGADTALGAPCRQGATSDLLAGINPDAVLALGDLQYERGQLEYFRSFYDPTWGRLKAITRPAPGNHEYMTLGANGYFDYFNGVGNFTGPAGL
jgi:acid phosphatase type 7